MHFNLLLTLFGKIPDAYLKYKIIFFNLSCSEIFFGVQLRAIRAFNCDDFNFQRQLKSKPMGLNKYKKNFSKELSYWFLIEFNQ